MNSQRFRERVRLMYCANKHCNFLSSEKDRKRAHNRCPECGSRQFKEWEMRPVPTNG